MVDERKPFGERVKPKLNAAISDIMLRDRQPFVSSSSLHPMYPFLNAMHPFTDGLVERQRSQKDVLGLTAMELYNASLAAVSTSSFDSASCNSTSRYLWECKMTLEIRYLTTDFRMKYCDMSWFWLIFVDCQSIYAKNPYHMVFYQVSQKKLCCGNDRIAGKSTNQGIQSPMHWGLVEHAPRKTSSASEKPKLSHLEDVSNKYPR